MKVPLEAVKELRNLTSASIADCRKILEETSGDIKRAMELIRKRGLEMAAKKQDRVTKEGRVEAYIHLGNKVGALLEVGCETDFVAKSPDFIQFTRDLAMQIVACSPKYIKSEDVPKEDLEHEKSKEEFFKAHCLLSQVYVKDPSITVKDYLGSIVAKMGENIVVRKFTRFKIGE